MRVVAYARRSKERDNGHGLGVQEERVRRWRWAAFPRARGRRCPARGRRFGRSAPGRPPAPLRGAADDRARRGGSFGYPRTGGGITAPGALPFVQGLGVEDGGRRGRRRADSRRSWRRRCPAARVRPPRWRTARTSSRTVLDFLDEGAGAALGAARDPHGRPSGRTDGRIGAPLARRHRRQDRGDAPSREESGEGRTRLRLVVPPRMGSAYDRRPNSAATTTTSSMPRKVPTGACIL